MAYGLEGRQTIFALASGLGKASVAIIRVSGAGTVAAIEALVGTLPLPRRAALRKIRDPEGGGIIDQGLVIWFPGPNSFTGEDSVELQVHGSRAVVASILRVLGKQRDLRLANPGEFARRALENGKLDLIEIEALGDLIEAETEYQRRLAVAQASGDLQKSAEKWRSELIDVLVMIECDLDFADERDAPHTTRAKVRAKCEEILVALAPMAIENRRVERVREGMAVLIAGPPNVGKSTLLNALARRDVAIVSERAGTTRDLIEVRLDLGGFPVNLIDSAGIQYTDDPVEQEGIRRALKKSASADLVLWLTSVDERGHSPPRELADRPLWIILTKADRFDEASDNIGDNSEIVLSAVGSVAPELIISAKTGRNFDKLLKRLECYANSMMSVEGSLIIANERQRSAICAAYRAIETVVDTNAPLEILAEELRSACFSLESLIGKVGVEDLLDQIFSRFCIGK